MRSVLLTAAFGLAATLCAQVPVIDYSFLAVPPSVLVNKVLVQPDGRILVGGSFANYAGTGKNNLVRLNADGSVDATFNPGGSGPDFLVQDMDLCPDGKILIAGSFLSYNGSPSYFVARLFANGLLDPGFNVPANAINGAVLAIAAHKDNTVLAAGEFFICNGHSQPYITRFTPTGAVDLDFLVGTGFTSTVRDLLVLPDDRVVACGDFLMYQENPCGRIALLGESGLYDPSMNTNPGLVGMGSSMGSTLARQPDGKVLVGGVFGHCSGVERSGIARMHMDGSCDATFVSALYPYAKVDAIAVLPGGRIMAGGEFIDGMYLPNVPGPSCLVRLNGDGSRDTSYDLGTGAGAGSGGTYFVRTLAVQPDEKVIVGGRFGTFATETQFQQLIRLLPTMTTGMNESDDLGVQLINGPVPELLFAQGLITSTTLTVHASDGRLLTEQRLPVQSAGTRVPLTGVDIGHGVLLVSLRDAHGTQVFRAVR